MNTGLSANVVDIAKLTTKLLSKKMIGVALCLGVAGAHAQVTLEEQVKISDYGLHFNGKKLNHGTLGTADTSDEVYDFFFGRNISAHGDAVKVYKNYVFMTWYRGGKTDRHVMLSRYNRDTGTVATIEFPHRHTGFRGDENIGESHNTIGITVSPINGTIHMVYDMHAYDNNNHDGKFKDDFFRYTYSVENTAEVSDEEFTLDKFVKDTSDISQGGDDYKHLTMTGNLSDSNNFARLTYPQFFTNTDGTVLLYMRLGGNNNGAYVFNRYDAQEQKWSTFTKFNENNQKLKGNDYNWGLYGNMKYVNGKLRVGFQQRSNDNNDRYLYQNGIYYAYSDHPDGFGDWKNHQGEDMTWPLVDSDEIKVLEPGDYITGHEDANSVHIVSGFDWTVTAKGDIHFISKLRSTDRNRADFQEVNLHSYKPAGSDEFITSTDFSGATNVYTSGDNVYIIGLDNGYPYVERAVGGTNNFERVYEQTQGTKFDHGVVYVKDGKVYYYLMERTSGDAMPLHLQIIDLDLELNENAPIVSFPSSTMTVDEGFEKLTLTLDAETPLEDRTIQSVTLFLNGEQVRVDDSVPYLFGHGSKPHETGAMGWLDRHEPNPNPLPAGEHLFTAIVTDSEGDTGRASMRLTVLADGPEVSFPSETLTVSAGYDKLSLTVTANAQEGREMESVTLYIDDELVRVDNSLPYLFGHGSKPHETGALGWLDRHEPNPNPFGPGEYEFKAIALDSSGATSETIMTLIVEGEAQPPTVSFPNEEVSLPEGFEQFTFSLDAEAADPSDSIVSVTLFVNDEQKRVDTRSPWNFGHRFAPHETGAMGWLDTHEPNPNPLPPGTHTFRAVATDTAGLQSEAIMTVTVTELPAPEVGFVESDVSIYDSYQELSISINAQAANDNIDLVSAGLYVNDTLVREIFEPPFTWGVSPYEQELLGLDAGLQNFTAKVSDSNGKVGETQMQVDVMMLGDLDADLDVDKLDVRAFTLGIRSGKEYDIAYDFNDDGVVDRRDVRGLSVLCTRPRCAV